MLMYQEIENACRLTGLLDPKSAEWIAPIVKEGARSRQGYEAIAGLVRQHGTPLADDQKRDIGVRRNAKLGTAYCAALTPKGLTRVMDAAFLVVQRVLHQNANADNIQQYQQMESVLKGVEIMAAKDDRTCKAARRIDGRIFPVSKVPALPLPDCDADYCRCLYAAVPKGFD